QPPCAAGDAAGKLRLAAQGDVSGAVARLDGCGEDAELVTLAKHCLAAEPGDRQADAGAVAKEVAAYQELVRERARRAAVVDGQARVRVEAERQKRRLTLRLAAVVVGVLLLGILGTTAALLRAWDQTDRAE